MHRHDPIELVCGIFVILSLFVLIGFVVHQLRTVQNPRLTLIGTLTAISAVVAVLPRILSSLLGG